MLIEGLPLVEIGETEAELAALLVAQLPLPMKAGADAVHIAAAACHRVDFLPTWNCAHIANAELRPRIEKVCRDLGHEPPILCTPDELMGEAEDA